LLGKPLQSLNIGILSAWKYHNAMPFNYAKINRESTEHSEESLMQAQIHIERGRSTMWTKTLDKVTVLRWPMAFLLLSAILVCEMSILHKQPTTQPIGGELNGLVPHCKLMASLYVAHLQQHSL
jgi:hypothetical protein